MLQDPLSLSIEGQGIETTIPVLLDGDKLFKVLESTIGSNKAGDGLNWELKLGLVNPETADGGREVKADFPLFMRMACQAKADSTDPEAFKRQIFQAVDAIFGSDKTNRPTFNQQLVSSAVGHFVVAIVTRSEYPKGSQIMTNNISRLKPAPAGL